VNTKNIMNITMLTGEALQRATAATLKGIFSELDWLSGWKVETEKDPSQGDLHLELSLPGGKKARLRVECKKDLRPGQFAAFAAKTRPFGEKKFLILPLLALPWMSPRMAQLCRAASWSWLDMAGNCRIEIPGFLFIERLGKEPIHSRDRPKVNLSTDEAGRLLRLLLAPENSGKLWTQRTIQRSCVPEVSLGLVNKLVRGLLDEAQLERVSAGGLRLREPESLLSAWSAVYRFNRHVRRGYFTLLSGSGLIEALADFAKNNVERIALAAFSAADYQAPSVRQAKTWLYLSEALEAEFRSRLEAKPVDSGENLVVLFPSDEGIFFGLDTDSAGKKGFPCTNAVQTYLDLSHAGGRGAEAADAILSRCLKPAWKSERVAP
jgi:hypothetical protein